MSARDDFVERRRAPRFRYACGVTYQEEGSEIEHEAKLYDISESGARIISRRLISVGRSIWLLAGVVFFVASCGLVHFFGSLRAED